MGVALKITDAKASIVTFDEGKLRDHDSGLIRQSVEDTLNALLDAEAGELCNA